MPEYDFDPLFARYRRDAILLYRPYPPHLKTSTNSKFGGLPRLPADIAWPRDAHGTALHFLAQIDCSDIKISSRLPDKGVLFFFGRDDEEQLWADTPKSASVIYSKEATASTVHQSPPPDLPPIGGEYYKAYAWRNLLLADEVGPNVHVEWPIQPLPIDSWPDTLFEDGPPETASFDWRHLLKQLLERKPQAESWQDEQKRYVAYTDRHEELRNDAFVRATGKPILEWNPLAGEREAAQRIFDHADAGPDAFPHFWIQIEYAVRTFIGSFGDRPTHGTYDEKHLLSARNWLRKAQATNGMAEVNAADKAAFRIWLMRLHKPRKGPPSPTPYAECVFHAVRLNIRSWAGDPDLSAKITPIVYGAMEPYLSGNSAWGLQYSQMLGHAPSAQSPLHPDEPDICLLNLASDAALGWMFGDVGNATFFIMPDALAKLDFSQVEADVVGH